MADSSRNDTSGASSASESTKLQEITPSQAQIIARGVNGDSARELIELVLESLPYPLCLIDASCHRVRLANSAAGLDPSSPNPKCHWLLHQRNNPCHENGEPCPVAIIKRTKKPTVVEHVHTDASGNQKYYEVHGYPVFDADGEVVSIIEYSLDVTERKRSEELLRIAHRDLENRVAERTSELEKANKLLQTEMAEREQMQENLVESEQLHRVILGHISDAVFASDDQGNLTWVGPNVGKFFGLSAEVLGNVKRTEELLGPNLFDQQQLDEQGELSNIKRTLSGKNGVSQTILVSVKRADVKGGSTFYTCRDITRLDQVEQALRAVNEELKVERQTLWQKNTALKEILGQIEQEKRRLTSQIHINVNRAAMPILNALTEKVTSEGKYFVSLLRSTLADLTSPFVSNLEKTCSGLTPRELEICQMIKNGLTSKEIAATLNSAVETVLKQRKSIRRKLGIARQEINLVTYLKSISRD